MLSPGPGVLVIIIIYTIGIADLRVNRCYITIVGAP